MPNRDGTGPEGKGPRTGGRRGNCAPAQTEEQRPRMHLGRGRGFGNRGRGRN